MLIEFEYEPISSSQLPKWYQNWRGDVRSGQCLSKSEILHSGQQREWFNVYNMDQNPQDRGSPEEQVVIHFILLS